MRIQSACPRCGRAIEPGTKFCSACGTEVSVEQGAAPTRRLPTTDLEGGLLEPLRQATLGEFEILKELGRGGMATVYLAHDLSLNRKVAIKVMSPGVGGEVSMSERFLREAQTAAALSHPNIIPVYSVKQTGAVTFFVMKFIAGRPLDDIMRELGPMPIVMVTAILTQVAGALGYGHKRGVVHRDVKPGNVMIDDEGWAVVTDFGIAKVEAAVGLTRTGAAIGTPTYMSPEQCTAREVGGASDQYSLGVMAYEMISGRKPFDGDSVMAIMYGHVNERPLDIRSKRADCPPSLADAVMRMLSKKPDDRFPDMDAVISAVGATPLRHDDPIRTQMITLAASGMPAKLLEQVRTPVSPLHLQGARSPGGTSGPRTAPPGSQAAATHSETSKPDARQTWSITGEKVRKGGRLVGTAIGLLAVAVGVGGLVVWSPWNRDATTSAPADPPTTQTVPVPRVARAASVELTAPTTTLVVGDELVVRATVTDDAGATMSEPVLSWQSADRSIATVTSDGVVTAVRPGRVSLSATSGPASGTISLTIEAPRGPTPAQPARVAAVAIEPDGGTVRVNESLRLTARARAADGQALNRAITWESSDPTIASVRNGVVTGHGVGTATIMASRDDGQDRVTVRVTPIPIQRVTVDPSQVTLRVSETTQLTARAFDPDGNLMSGQSFDWQSTDPRVAGVVGGRVTATGAGTATISAHSGGQVAAAQITVETPPAPVQPEPEPVARGPTEAESRAEIAQLVQDFARALESRDMGRIRQAAPDIQSTTAASFRDFVNSVRELSVELRVTDIRINGATATASIDGQYDFRTSGPRQTARPTFIATFELRGGRWTMIDILGR
jgi:serine/threonine protein kinase